MKRKLALLALCAGLFNSFAGRAGKLWQQVSMNNVPKNLQVIHPTKFSVYTVDEATLKLQLFTLSNDPTQGMIISLPMPDGTYRDFTVWQTPMMPGELASRHPDIKTFTAKAIDNPLVIAKLDFTVFGFHAMIFDGANTCLIDPFDNFHDGFYMSHYKRDETRSAAEQMKCQVVGFDERGPAGQSMDIVQKGLPGIAFKTSNGYQLRTYRLALGCDHQYAIKATGLPTPTVDQAFSKMTTSMNRVNGIYELELSITMNFVNNEDALIFTTSTGDPYGPYDSDPGTLLDVNETECDALIGDGNYDLGHVFTTDGGGLSLVGVVCQSGMKAKSETGSVTPVGDAFDVDYVAHEMGHEFGGNHPFNSPDCGSANINPPTAYEPGSGSTIMAYAGVCPPDDIQYHSDAYFHAANLLEIQAYTTGLGDCGVKTATGNKLVAFAPFATSYYIPYRTPFELYAPALADSVENTSTLYCWEEWDLGDVGQEMVNTHLAGPIFRSYPPTQSNLRVFPRENFVLSNMLYNDHTEGSEGEKVPDTGRTLHFVCTFRDIFNNFGCYTVPDDQITLSAINTGAGFAVTSQGVTGISYNGHSTQTVTWNVVNTTAPPISTSNVDISMSVDGGYTWAYFVGTFPNTGSANITVPNPVMTTASARFKVKGAGNVFFNVNGADFVVVNNPGFPISPNTAAVAVVPEPGSDVKIFPVPATDVLHVTAGSDMKAVVYNTLGQVIWRGDITGQSDIQVATWAKGMYYMQLTGTNDQRVVKKLIVE